MYIYIYTYIYIYLYKLYLYIYIFITYTYLCKFCWPSRMHRQSAPGATTATSKNFNYGIKMWAQETHSAQIPINQDECNIYALS